MNNKNRKSFNFELEKLINLLENPNSSKTIAIAGKINNKKTKLINSLYQYMSHDQVQKSCSTTNFLSSILEANGKKNEMQKIDTENLFVNKGVYSFNSETILESLSDSLHVNLFLKTNKKRGKRYSLFEKTILKKISIIQKHNLRTNSSNRLKVIFPILTTITTIGTSIGTPILSIALLRYKEIMETFGTVGYNILIWLCGSAIVLGIVSVIFYLVTSIISSKYELISSNLLDGYKKLLLKHFLLPSQKEENLKKKRKIEIIKKSNYFFNEINFSDKNYHSYLDLLKVHNALGNNVCFTVSINENFELKNLFNDSWGGSNNYFVFDINNYKNGYNKQRIIDFMLSRTSKDFKLNLINLYKNNDNFKMYIDQFYETSDNNLQILNVLNTFKSSPLANIQKNINMDEIDYLIDILYIYLIKSLDFYTFDLLFDSLLTDLSIPKEVESKYNLMKLANFFTKNFWKYKENALIFNLNYINDEYYVGGVLNQTKKETKQNKIQDFLQANNFKILKNRKKVIYINNSNELLKIVQINKNEVIDNIFELIKNIKIEAHKEKVSYLIIDFGFNCIIFQNNLGNFQVISN